MTGDWGPLTQAPGVADYPTANRTSCPNSDHPAKHTSVSAQTCWHTCIFMSSIHPRWERLEIAVVRKWHKIHIYSLLPATNSSS